MGGRWGSHSEELGLGSSCLPLLSLTPEFQQNTQDTWPLLAQEGFSVEVLVPQVPLPLVCQGQTAVWSEVPRDAEHSKLNGNVEIKTFKTSKCKRLQSPANQGKLLEVISTPNSPQGPPHRPPPTRVFT